ncbi:MAG: hypothetical protein LUD47_07570 [Clostridia bacterium]|nr:hypothetical protein [Clostridia bacterium]
MHTASIVCFWTGIASGVAYVAAWIVSHGEGREKGKFAKWLEAQGFNSFVFTAVLIVLAFAFYLVYDIRG